jgi:hypothetical protein
MCSCHHACRSVAVAIGASGLCRGVHHASGGLCPCNFCSTARFALRILDASCFLVLGSRAQAPWWKLLGDGAPRGQHWLVNQPGQADNTVTLATALLLSLLFFHLSSVTLLGLQIFHLFCLSLSPMCVSLSLSLPPLCVSEYAAVAGMWHVAGSGSGEENERDANAAAEAAAAVEVGEAPVSLSHSLSVCLCLSLFLSDCVSVSKFACVFSANCDRCGGGGAQRRHHAVTMVLLAQQQRWCVVRNCVSFSSFTLVFLSTATTSNTPRACHCHHTPRACLLLPPPPPPPPPLLRCCVPTTAAARWLPVLRLRHLRLRRRRRRQTHRQTHKHTDKHGHTWTDTDRHADT